MESNSCPGGRHLQYIKSGVMECNIGIQALWDLTTVAKRPGGKAAGTLKPSHIFYLLPKLSILCSW